MPAAKKPRIPFSTFLLVFTLGLMAWLFYPEAMYRVQAAPYLTPTPMPPSPSIWPTTSAYPTTSPYPSTATGIACNRADINQDGYVNNWDYDQLLTNFLSSGVILRRSDINDDGVVNLLDYSILAAEFGKTTGACQ